MELVVNAEPKVLKKKPPSARANSSTLRRGSNSSRRSSGKSSVHSSASEPDETVLVESNRKLQLLLEAAKYTHSTETGEGCSQMIV